MIFVITLVVFVIAIVGMAVGVIFSNRCLQGSCGGMAKLKDATGKPMCESCQMAPVCEDKPVGAGVTDDS